MTQEKQNGTFYPNLKPEMKRKLKEGFIKVVESRKLQIQYIEEHIIRPMKINVKMHDDVIKGNVPIERYIKESIRLSDFITRIFKDEGEIQ